MAASLAFAKEANDRTQIQVSQVQADVRYNDGPIEEWPLWPTPQPVLQRSDPIDRLPEQLDEPISQWAPTLLDRASCSEIRGTEYYSESERDWFLQSCKAPAPSARVSDGNVQVQSRQPTASSGNGGSSLRDPGLSGGTSFTVTHYGASYNGSPLGCTGRLYSSGDPSIVATAWRPDGSRTFPCGTVLRLSGPSGTILGVVQDACPGCGWYHLDLSEAGILAVCGGYGTCTVQVTEE